MKKTFIAFLKKKGIYASYRKNIGEATRKEIKDGYIPYSIISYSFNWRETKEGYDFWNAMSSDWSNYCFYGKY